jgi:hypothetical protein
MAAGTWQWRTFLNDLVIYPGKKSGKNQISFDLDESDGTAKLPLKSY